MSDKSEALKQRTFTFALDILDLVDGFPQKTSAFVVGKQLAKAATAVAANYRATCVARSRAEFEAKLGVVHEEADESQLWTSIAQHKRFGDPETLKRLDDEATALMKIFAKSLVPLVPILLMLGGPQDRAALEHSTKESITQPQMTK